MKVKFKNWEKMKEKEWHGNTDYWAKIIRNNLDPFRTVITYKAVLRPIKKNKRRLKILDVGCGEGYLCRKLARLGHQVFGLDFCGGLIEKAKELERKKPLGIKYFIGDLRKTNFPAAYFDVILSHQSLQEIENPEKAIREFSRIIKKEGKIIALFLHPCFDIRKKYLRQEKLPQLYFNKSMITGKYYIVSGLKSPLPYFNLHLPLSGWIKLFRKYGFLNLNIDEPHPPLKFLKKNKWWRKNFDRPVFILIEAIKL